MVNMMWVCPFSTSTALLWLMLSNLIPLAARTWSPTLIPCCSASPPGSTLGMIQHRTSTRGAFERKIRLFLSKQGRSRRKWYILRMGERATKRNKMSMLKMGRQVPLGQVFFRLSHSIASILVSIFNK